MQRAEDQSQAEPSSWKYPGNFRFEHSLSLGRERRPPSPPFRTIPQGMFRRSTSPGGRLGLAGVLIPNCSLGLGCDGQQLEGRAEDDRSARRGDSCGQLCGCSKADGTAVADCQVSDELTPGTVAMPFTQRCARWQCHRTTLAGQVALPVGADSWRADTH